MAKKIITFGEIMMRLNPEGYLRFVQADKFEASSTGCNQFCSCSIMS